MKRSILILILCCFIVTSITAQSVCEKRIDIAEKYLEGKNPFKTPEFIYKFLKPCADNGFVKAENFLAMMYLKGLGVEKDEQKAFQYFESAALKNYHTAQYNLGRMYKYGFGCELSFETAIEWFEKATNNGNQRAAYSVGYMYYKGFGVPQDYSKAVYWFKRSDDPMAKHFLALCYYFGYGIDVDENKALEILASNNILNSQTMLNYVGNEQKQKVENVLDNQLTNIDSENDEIINSDNTSSEAENSQYFGAIAIEKDDLVGHWTGKLMQYDWSRQHLRRIIPIELKIKKNGGKLAVDFIVNGKNHTSSAQWLYDQLYIDDITFPLDKLYSSHPKELSLDHTIISLGLKLFEGENTNYFIGALDNYLISRTEYGFPMSVILKSASAQSFEDEEMLLALASQSDQFIKLYPVPFNEKLTIQYQIENAGNVLVELINFNTAEVKTISQMQWQEPGTYTHNINTPLPKGIYVARVRAANQVFTRLVIKEN